MKQSKTKNSCARTKTSVFQLQNRVNNVYGEKGRLKRKKTNAQFVLVPFPFVGIIQIG
jgi:hypothetical protein